MNRIFILFYKLKLVTIIVIFFYIVAEIIYLLEGFQSDPIISYDRFLNGKRIRDSHGNEYMILQSCHVLAYPLFKYV